MSGVSRLPEMIDELNNYVDGTLCISHSQKDWELYSYGPGTLFEGQTLYAATFEEVVDKAYKMMCKDKIVEEERLKDLQRKYKCSSDYIYRRFVSDLTTQLKGLMKNKGASANLLAGRMGVDSSYITKILKGGNLSLENLARILAALEAKATLSINEEYQQEE